MSTQNFNSSASSGALLMGQIIGSESAVEDGRAGLMQFPFWLWTHNSGVGQEYIDHYYWSIATAGNKLFADYCERPEDRMVRLGSPAYLVERIRFGASRRRLGCEFRRYDDVQLVPGDLANQLVEQLLILDRASQSPRHRQQSR